MPFFGITIRFNEMGGNMICPKCGTVLSDAAKFCGSCGAAVASASGADVAPAFDANDEQTVFLSAEQPTSSPAPIQQNEDTLSNADVKNTAADLPFPDPVPVYQQPPQAPVYQQPVQQYPSQQTNFTSAPVAKKKIHGGVVAVVCILFGILIFLLGLYAAVAQSTRTMLDEKQLSQEIKEIDVLDVVVGDIMCSDFLREDIEQLLNDYHKNIDDIDDDTTVSEFVIIIADDEDVTEKTLRKIVDETTVMDYICDVVESYEKYILQNKDGNVVTVDSLKELMDKNVDEVSEVLGRMFQIDEEMLDEELENNKDKIRDINPQNALDGIGGTTSLLLSPAFIIGAAAAVIILLILIGVICRSFCAPLATGGICSVLVGGVLIAVCTAKNAIADIIGFSYSAVNDVLFELLDSTLLGEMLRCGVIIAAAGVVLIIAAIIVKVVTASVRRVN